MRFKGPVCIHLNMQPFSFKQPLPQGFAQDVLQTTPYSQPTQKLWTRLLLTIPSEGFCSRRPLSEPFPTGLDTSARALFKHPPRQVCANFPKGDKWEPKFTLACVAAFFRFTRHPPRILYDLASFKRHPPRGQKQTPRAEGGRGEETSPL